MMKEDEEIIGVQYTITKRNNNRTREKTERELKNKGCGQFSLLAMVFLITFPFPLIS